VCSSDLRVKVIVLPKSYYSQIEEATNIGII
jgi:hypothetical protein